MVSRVTSRLAIVAALFSGMPLVAQAQFITDPSGYDGAPTVISFSQFTERTTFLPQTITAGGVSVTLVNTTPRGVNASPAIFNDRFNIGGYFPQFPELSDPAFCINGAWSSARQGFVGMFPGTSVRFDFGGTLLSSAGAFMNYVPVCGVITGASMSAPRMRLLGSDNSVLADYNIDELARIITPNRLDAGAFRGARREQGDIAAVEFVGGFLLLDDFGFVASAVSTPVPEPQSLALIGAGIAGMVASAARRRRVESGRRGAEGGAP